ncbi:MAG: ABC transporter permease [candidate division Zixibacteria bacterium]|nr:ABC transporter permease [candidate division Zixibacteria bacterium]
MRKIRFIAQKEVYHILRDPRSLVIVFAMPILMTFLFGYAINMDIENITIAVADYDKTAASRQLTGDFINSTYFTPSAGKPAFQDPERLLKTGGAAGILTIRPGFAEALANGTEFELGMTVDGADAQLALAVQAYSNVLLSRFLLNQLPPGTNIGGVRISTLVKYNPDLKSSQFFVPGLVAILLLMISALLTSITIAREKETGTMEQLLTAPVKPREILLGKIIPYVVIAFLDGILVLIFAKVIFGMPFVGSKMLLLLFGLIYVTAALSIGILISSLVSTQQVAMMAALVTTVLPSVMLSGFMFAIKNMPTALQVLSHIVPARYFLVIIRGIMLKGSGLQILATQAAALVMLTLVLLTLASRKFKTTVG